MENVIYRTLKENNKELFSQKFTKLFEQHVGHCLADANIANFNEDRLKEILPVGKYVDFLVVEEECNILIESKGIEMPEIGRITHDPRIISQSLKESVGSAIIQAMDTAIRIRAMKTGGNDSGLFGSNRCFLIIATYAPLYLGPPQDLHFLLGERFIEKLRVKFGNALPFELEDIFLLTSEEIENLAAHIRAGDTSLLKFLQFAAENNTRRESRKFTMGQHLNALFQSHRQLPIMEKALDGLFARGMRRFPT